MKPDEVAACRRVDVFLFTALRLHGDSRSSLKTEGFLPCHGVMQWSRDIFTKFQKPCLSAVALCEGGWSRSLWSLVKTFRYRFTCLSRRNLRSRWRRMKFSPFLLRQGCGGQAGSKDGVIFYCASLKRWQGALKFTFAMLLYSVRRLSCSHKNNLCDKILSIENDT